MRWGKLVFHSERGKYSTKSPMVEVVLEVLKALVIVPNIRKKEYGSLLAVARLKLASVSILTRIRLSAH